jgi:hypothetical protein
MKDNFNSKVYDLRNKKAALIERLDELNAMLTHIHRELDPTQRKFLSEIPKFDEKLEFPEREFKVGLRLEVSMTVNVKAAVFWGVTPWSLVDINQSVPMTYCLHTLTL